jgi:hyperosmotically inducible protein
MRIHGIALSGLLVCLTLAGAALTTGCAGDRYQRSTGAYLDDKGITTRVKTALFRDPNVSGFDVHVDTFRGNVQLNGFVDTPEQKEHAASLAREVAGVQEVTNNLEVKPMAVGAPGATIQNSSGTVTGPAADVPQGSVPVRDTTRLDDRSRLNDRDRVLDQTVNQPTYNPNYNPNINPPPADTPLNTARNVEITSANGRATVRGFVSSEDEKRAIGRKLLAVPGVVTVDNQLQVQPIIPAK